MSSQTIIGWVNIAKLASIVASSAEDLLPPENTINDIGAPSAGWQTADGVTSASIEYTFDQEGSSVRMVGIFRSNLTPNAQINVTITHGGSDTWTGTLAGPRAGYGQVVFILPETEYADSVTIEIEDAENPDGHINVPLVFIGDAWLPTYSVSPSLNDGWQPQQNIQLTRGGQAYVTELSNPRVMSFDFGAIAQDEAYTAPRELARLAGLGTNVLIIPDGNADEIQYEAIFGMITAPRPMGTVPGTRLRTWSATVTERL